MGYNIIGTCTFIVLISVSFFILFTQGPLGRYVYHCHRQKVGDFRELQYHPSRAAIIAPLACTAGTTLRSRTFCSRRGRSTASFNPLFVASQQYPEQLNVIWYRKECDFKCQQMMNDWGAKILLSCKYPQQWHMHEADEIHTSDMHRKKKKEKRLLLESFISASEYVLVTTAKHFYGQRKTKIGDSNSNRVPKAPPSVTDWIFV